MDQLALIIGLLLATVVAVAWETGSTCPTRS